MFVSWIEKLTSKVKKGFMKSFLVLTLLLSTPVFADGPIVADRTKVMAFLEANSADRKITKDIGGAHKVEKQMLEILNLLELQRLLTEPRTMGSMGVDNVITTNETIIKDVERRALIIQQTLETKYIDTTSFDRLVNNFIKLGLGTSVQFAPSELWLMDLNHKNVDGLARLRGALSDVLTTQNMTILNRARNFRPTCQMLFS